MFNVYNSWYLIKLNLKVYMYLILISIHFWPYYYYYYYYCCCCCILIHRGEWVFQCIWWWTHVIYKDSTEICLPVPLHCGDRKNLTLTPNTTLTLTLSLTLTQAKPNPNLKPHSNLKFNLGVETVTTHIIENRCADYSDIEETQ